MTVREYRKKFQIDSNRMYSIGLMYWPETTSKLSKRKTKAQFLSIINNYEMPEIPILNVLDEMVFLNRMVKNPMCPKNIKNQFYEYKRRIIIQLIEAGRVHEVTHEGSVYNFSIDNGKYNFHQLCDEYVGFDFSFYNINVKKGEKYINQKSPNPVNIARFMEWKLFIITYNIDGFSGINYFEKQ